MDMKLTIAPILVLLAALLSPQAATSQSLKDIALPASAKLELVSRNLNHNGQLLSISTFNSSDSVESVLAFYRQAWEVSGDVPGYVENTLEQWQVISQLENDISVVLQIKDRTEGGSTGFLSVMTLKGNTASPDIGMPTPDHTTLVSNTYAEENNTDAHTAIYISQASISSVKSFYLETLQRQDWQLATQKEEGGHAILLFNKSRDRCEIVIGPMDDGSTVIFLNRVNLHAI